MNTEQTPPPPDPTSPGINAFCPNCAYDLRATPTNRCPECGQDLTGLRDPTPIPWENRRQIGRLRAYFQTAWRVRVHHCQFCENIAHPVSYPDAQAFRWTTIAAAYLLVLVGTILNYVLFPPPDTSVRPKFDVMSMPRVPTGPEWHEQAYAEIWPVILLHVGLILFLIAATGVPSYLFHPKRAPMHQQNAAVALSYYTCSPLVCFAIAFFPLAASLYHLASDVAEGFSLTIPGALIALFIAMLWWVNLARLARLALPQIRGREAVVAVGVPVLWLLVAALTLVLVPAILFAIIVVIASLA